MGSYGNQLIVRLPAWFESSKRDSKIGIDKCLFGEVTDLWAQGIETIECCCGHNKVDGYISVSPKHRDSMILIGYQPIDENHIDAFKPKSC